MLLLLCRVPVPNVVPSQGVVSRRARERIAGQSSCVLWFTGLSGSGKSTIAHVVEGALAERRKLAYVLDGDNLRHRLNSDLGFSATDRSENIRRAGEVAAILADAGLIVLSTFISPFRSDRARVRDAVGPERFLEIHVDAPLEVCERRDPKGFYRRARAGEIAEFTGISSPYEPPVAAALRLATAEMNVAEGAAAVVALLDRRGFLAPPSEGV